MLQIITPDSSAQFWPGSSLPLHHNPMDSTQLTASPCMGHRNLPPGRIHRSHRTSPHMLNPQQSPCLWTLLPWQCWHWDECTHADIACPHAVPIGMSTSGISVTKSSQDSTAIVQREPQDPGGMKCHWSVHTGLQWYLAVVEHLPHSYFQKFAKLQ